MEKVALRKSLIKSYFRFSGDIEHFITYISYFSLATVQFMGVYNILSLCYGGYNKTCIKKNLTRTDMSLHVCF